VNAATSLFARAFAVLVPVTILVYAGTVIGLDSAYHAELWRFRGIVSALYFLVFGGAAALLTSLGLGYGWTRGPLAAIAWGVPARRLH
jgi:hypothetical protein